tara:strand:- start:2390 stop:4105 length:1716 start_codon:yes stop_codon:yes gene_type:complete
MSFMVTFLSNHKLRPKIHRSSYFSNLSLTTVFAFILLMTLTINCASGINDSYGVKNSPIGDQPTVGKHVSQIAIDSGNIELDQLIEHGSLLFSAQFNSLDGAGRPETTGVGDSPFRSPRVMPDNFNRISGPDANACVACHNVPVVGGGGDNVTNVFVDSEVHPFVNFDGGEGDGFDDALTLKTVGVERNSVGLFGAGFIEMLAREMTFDLHKIRDDAINKARSSGSDIEVKLITKDVDFGKITARPDGTIDTSFIDGVDDDLIIKPFQQKGVIVSLREFAVKATNNHHGMQASERFRDGIDADGDGMADELTRGDITALVVFMATLPVPGSVLSNDPYVRTASVHGETIFNEIGCNTCHKPYLRLDNPIFTEPNPFNPPGKLKLSDVSAPFAIDLTQEGPGPFLKKDDQGGVLVPAFTDLKRHDMGPALDTDEIRQKRQIPGGDQLGIATEEWLTRKLWGVASEPPFLHHGRATLISEAILLHGGEAEQQRVAFENLSEYDQAAVVEFIKTLQILPEDSNTTIIDPGSSSKKLKKAGSVTLSILGGILGGVFFVLTVAVGLILYRNPARKI